MSYTGFNLPLFSYQKGVWPWGKRGKRFFREINDKGKAAFSENGKAVDKRKNTA
jgi:hypothetical protein